MRIVPTLVSVHGKERWRVRNPMTGARRFFQEQAAAEIYATQLRHDMGTVASGFHHLSNHDQTRVLWCIGEVKGDIELLCRIVDEYNQHKKPKANRSLSDARDEFLAVWSKRGCKPRYIGALRSTLKHFVADHGGRACADVTHAMITDWIQKQELATATQRSYLIDLTTFFGFCRNYGYVADNPAAKVPAPRIEDKPPGILTPDQCTTLFAVARTLDPRLIPWLSLQAFGGLRRAEASSTTWDQVRPGFVEVLASTSKTRQRRLVTKNPTLAAWLELGGDLPPVNVLRRFYRVRKSAGIDWPPKCLRHSFCTYALPIWGEVRTTADAGHSPAVLLHHYRELVSPKEAKRWWKIKPKEI